MTTRRTFYNVGCGAAFHRGRKLTLTNMADNTLIGIAGVHHVVSELSRRGVIALPTVKNTAAYDIVALNVLGTKHANIQVKASSKKALFFPMPRPDRIRTNEHDFFVLARWLENEMRYECFLLSGRTARQEVERSLALQAPSIERGTRKVEFPCVHVGKSNEEAAKRWNRAWLDWAL